MMCNPSSRDEPDKQGLNKPPASLFCLPQVCYNNLFMPIG